MKEQHSSIQEPWSLAMLELKVLFFCYYLKSCALLHLTQESMRSSCVVISRQLKTSGWWGNPLATCASARLLLFQLCEKCCTTFMHTPTALPILLSSFIALVTAKFKLWLKQDRWANHNLLMTATMFDSLSVVIHTCCFDFKSQDSKMVSSASAMLFPVWSCGRNNVYMQAIILILWDIM